MKNHRYITGPGLRISFVILILCCIAPSLHAQLPEFVLKGVVFKEGTVQRMGKVLVADITNGSLTSSDDLGIFQLKCSLGDTLLFRQKDYADKKTAVTGTNTIMVYLKTNIFLSEISIRGLTQKQELQQVLGEYNSQGIYANGKPSVASAIISPLNGLYDLLGSGPKQARRFKRYSTNELEQNEIDRRFTRALVTRITGLTDDKKLQDFMVAYKPSYQDIKAWNDYDLIKHIRQSFVDFQNNDEKISASQNIFKRDTTTRQKP